MKIIRLLINNFHSTSFNYDARETEIIRGVEVLHLQTYVSLETVGKNSAVFVAHLSKVLFYIYIYICCTANRPDRSYRDTLLNTQEKRVLKADKNLNETAIDTRACLYAPRNNLLVLVKRIHKVHCTGKVSGSIM